MHRGTNDSLPIKRYDVTRGCRMVEYDGMAYFTGHVYPKVDTRWANRWSKPL